MTDDLDDRTWAVSYRVGVAGCWALVPTGPGGQPVQCGGGVEWCGLVLRERPAVEAWPAFACPRHAARLIASRELLPRDREVLDAWVREADRWRPGHPRRPTVVDPWVAPRPLAVDVDARQLVARAHWWAERHGEQ